MDVFFVWCNIFVICGLPYMIKYSALGDAKYSPHTDDCGYMAPFSVSRIPICLRLRSLLMLKISFWSGSDG